MSQISITGRVVAAQPFFSTESFRKQTLIIEVVNGNFTSYFPIDFTQANIDNVLPQVQMGGTYTFVGYVQGSKNQMQDRNGNPTAYLSISVNSVAPAASALPPTTPATAPQPGFGQPQGGFVGQPQQQAQPQQPAVQPNQGFGAPAPSQQQPQGFGSQPQQGFGAPQTTPAQGFGNTPANGNGFGQQ